MSERKRGSSCDKFRETDAARRIITVLVPSKKYFCHRNDAMKGCLQDKGKGIAVELLH